MKTLVLLFTLVGCVSPGTEIEIERDPTTGAIAAHLERGWLAGPVDITADYTAPDGTKISFRWLADVNLDAAARARTRDQEILQKALELAATLGARP